MKKIHQLSPDIIAKIAAGEVIERPAFAVKELIDNAVDSGASFIKINIDKAGLERITVTDNGGGMSKDDIAECFKPHTTSKIKVLDDLNHIFTLGFRGEALSSIAAISDLIIKSRTTKDTQGNLVELQRGKLKDILPIGIPSGTTIMVDNLFYSVPARKKFLKSDQTEFRHILDIVIGSVLAYPKIRFSLTHNNKLIFDLPPQDILKRIKTLLGDSTFNYLLPLNYKDSYVRISGFISTPQITTQTQSKNFIFINQRKVTDKLISLAVKESYGNLIEPNVYPVFILFLSLPYEIVDVNVHPRKEQVSFVDARLVFDAVNKAVSQTLAKNNLTFRNLIHSNSAMTKSFAGVLLKNAVLPKEDIGQIIKSSDIIQVHNTYLITQTRHGILVIDQHAAHERILYEEFCQAFQKHKKEIFHLPTSIILDLSLSEGELLEENIDVLKDLGFEIEKFKENLFKVYAIPLLFKDRDCQKLVMEILDDIMQNKDPKKVDEQSNRMIEYLACRAAIKAGDKLTKQECKDLLEKLEKTKSNYTCPHGRPVKIEMTVYELSKYFKRV
ncbi:MAG: DNA mismatch repair endonuclease MutL [Candidatus Roizmanbacteria bacterium]|nr:MAG: DNA mismatch repair endonuclease MutL [Candidatus Roizmanbacteria bacterium]